MEQYSESPKGALSRVETSRSFVFEAAEDFWEFPHSKTYLRLTTARFIASIDFTDYVTGVVFTGQNRLAKIPTLRASLQREDELRVIQLREITELDNFRANTTPLEIGKEEDEDGGQRIDWYQTAVNAINLHQACLHYDLKKLVKLATEEPEN